MRTLIQGGWWALVGGSAGLPLERRLGGRDRADELHHPRAPGEGGRPAASVAGTPAVVSRYPS
jgi:hypothetical protein